MEGIIFFILLVYYQDHVTVLSVRVKLRNSAVNIIRIYLLC